MTMKKKGVKEKWVDESQTEGVDLHYGKHSSVL